MIQGQKFFMNAVAQIPKDIKLQVELSMGIADHLANIMQSKGITSKKLAQRTGMPESDVHKWLSGQYDFNLSTIAKVSDAIGEDLVKIQH